VTRRSLEELDAENLFQRLHPMTYGRLRDVKLLGCPPEVKQRRNRNERLNLGNLRLH
jgi:hypothetical protein